MRKLEDVLKDLEEAEREFKEKCDRYGIEEIKKKKPTNKINNHVVINGNIVRSDIDLIYLRVIQNKHEILYQENIVANSEIAIDDFVDEGEIEFEIKTLNGDIFNEKLAK